MNIHLSEMALVADPLTRLPSADARGSSVGDRSRAAGNGRGARRRSACRRLFLAATLWGVGLCGLVMAVEPAEEFLQELKNRGYHELALEYLERLETSPVASREFRETIDFAQGEVLIQSALRQRTVSRKQEDLDRAQQEFESFVRPRPEHALALPAQGRLAEIILERARLFAAQANTASDAPSNSGALDDARRLFDEAADSFSTYQGRLRTRLEQFPKTLTADADAALIKERDLLRNEYVQAQFVAAMARYEQALTYPEGSRERARRIDQTEGAFKVVAEKYRRRLLGLTAVLMQGRCRQMSNDPRGALSFFEDLLTLPDNETAARPLKTKALRGAMECWLTPDVAQYEAARQRAEAWLQKQRPDERDDNDWAMVKLLLAETYQHIIGSGAAGRDRSELAREARRLALEVARSRGEGQQRAQALLAGLGHVTQTVAQTKPATTFDEAMTAAREALSERQIAAQSIALLRQRMAEVSDAASRNEMEQRLDESDQQLKRSEENALSLLRQAQDLVTDETPIEQVNQARYYLCTLYYYREDFHSAAVLADFLSSRFPASEEGRRAAAVSLASLVRLYGDGTAPDAASVQRRMIGTAQRIARQWSGEPEADDALATLVTVSVQQGDLATAEEHLTLISADSPKRGPAELAVGQAIWIAAIQAASSGTDVAQVEPQQKKAVELMRQGLEHSAGTEPTSTMLAAALIVAQHLLNEGNAGEAIAVLENKSWGPKALADQGHRLLQAADMRQRTYLLSMMAYVGSLGQSESSEALIDKVTATLEKMKADSPNDAAQQQQQLASTYVVLARSLQEQIQSAPPQRAAELTGAFAEFLQRAVSSSRDLTILSWAAQAYADLGAALAAGSPDPSAARPYYDKSITTYQELLRRSDAGDFTMTVQERLVLETRLATVLRDVGRYEEAVDRLATVLSRQPNQVYVQMEAARTLHRWGHDGNPAAYLLAISGDRADAETGRNLIWGYGRTARLIAGRSELDDLFYEARYALAECRFKYAMSQSEPKRAETLRQAEQDIVMTARLYPELGGPERKEKYQRLLREIQQSMGKRPTG